METLGSRLQHTLNLKGLTQEYVANAVGVSQTAISDIVIGKTKRPRNILDIAKVLGVSPDWLMTGKGEQPSFSQAVENIDTEEEEKHQVRIEVLNVYASAGNGEFLTGDLAGDIQAVEFESEYFYNLFQRASEKGLAIVNVKGDSMEPTLTSGDLLFVDTSLNCYQGDGLYVFSFGDSLYVKRLQRAGRRLLVLSDNKLYEKWEVDASNEYEFFIHGKVEFLQGKIRRVG